MNNYKEMESCAITAQGSSLNTYEIDNNRIKVESFYVGKNSLSDLLVEIAKRNLATN